MSQMIIATIKIAGLQVKMLAKRYATAGHILIQWAEKNRMSGVICV